MATFLHGKKGKITIAASDFCVVGWTATLETELTEVTGTCSSGNRQYISGLFGGNGTFDAVYDLDDPITAKVVDIVKGASFALELFIGDPVNGEKISGTGIVSSTEISSTVEGRVEVSCSFNFTGPITVPT
jgi:hypothetical protein